MATASIRDDGPARLDERRAALRLASRRGQVVVADAHGPGEPQAGWVVNYSLGGLRLAVGRAVPAGTVLKVRPGKVSDFAPWFAVRVVYCFAQHDRWILGCQFLHAPSAGELLLFA